MKKYIYIYIYIYITEYIYIYIKWNHFTEIYKHNIVNQLYFNKI